MDDNTPLFSRSPVRGKRSSDVKARVTDETKEALKRKCNELGITESDYIDRLLCVSLFGMEAVANMERAKSENVTGLWAKMWNKVDT